MKRVAIVGGSAFLLAAALAGAVTVVRSGDTGQSHRALAPVRSPASTPRMAPPEPPATMPESDQSPAQEQAAPSQADQGPPPPPAAARPIDWNLLVASFKATQAAAQNDPTAESVPAGLKAAGELVTNAVMYATYSGDGERILTGLLNSLNGADLPAIASAAPPELPQVAPPDFTGLSEAYAALSTRPSPMGVTGPPPQLPAPAIGLPSAQWADAGVAGWPTQPSAPDLAFVMQPPPPPAPIWLTLPPLPGLSQAPGLPS